MSVSDALGVSGATQIASEFSSENSAETPSVFSPSMEDGSRNFALLHEEWERMRATIAKFGFDDVAAACNETLLS